MIETLVLVGIMAGAFVLSQWVSWLGAPEGGDPRWTYLTEEADDA